jgi:hypothetical protein
MTRRRTHWKSAVLALAAVAALAGAWAWSRGAPARLEAATATDTVTLAATCNNVALTWPGGTPISMVAAAVSPANALESIWKQTIVGDDLRFTAWSPLPGAPNDYTATALQLEAVFICMRAGGTLERPNVMR